MFAAAIFDMDGLLIDSEPLWRRAEQRVFAALGVELTDDMCRETTGLRLDEVVSHWLQRQPWRGQTIDGVKRALLTEVAADIARQGRAMEGVPYILNFFQQRDVAIALASSSPAGLIQAVLNKLEISEFFQVVVSAAELQYGKPHPAVYTLTAERLGVDAEQCLAFEDSVPGLQAAKAAGMTAVAVPDSDSLADAKFEIADLKLCSLREFNQQHLRQLASR